jgi:hypothetical protein
MYRWSCLGTFSVATAVEAVKDVRSERVVARVFCNGIRQGVIPQVAGSPGSAETRTWLFIDSEKVTASENHEVRKNACIAWRMQA